jgi:CubicO group peptidase (beta-lactamase class C family)
MKVFFLPLTFFITGIKISSQQALQRLDSFFTELNSHSQINGNVLVSENGRVIYKNAFGFANLEAGTPNNNNSEFTLGSVSKILTSTAILQLKEKGKLKLDDPFVNYFLDFNYPDITIRHLLSHTSGLFDYELFDSAIKRNPSKSFTINDILPLLKASQRPLLFKPGEKWKYSNINYCLLALLVEKLSGKSFQKYMETNIFKPAGMSQTCFQMAPAKVSNKSRTVNYEFQFWFSTQMSRADSLKRNQWRSYNLSGLVGQGNIMTTTSDMLKFDEALYSGKLLKAASLAEAFTPYKLNNGQLANAANGTLKSSYGLGWFIGIDTSYGKIVWHSGGVPGGLSIFFRNLSKKQTVIAFDNTFNTGLYKYGLNALDILNDQPLVGCRQSLTRDYNRILQEKGVEAAFCKLYELKDDSLHYYLSEDDMNELGLQMLYAAGFNNHKEYALEILRQNVLLFPYSFNTYDSYAEALANVGKKAEAVIMYKKSIALNPSNENGKKALAELLQ